MSIDKFGRYSQNFNKKHANITKKPINNIVGFTLDQDDNINIHYKRIKKLKLPIEDSDAASKEFVISILNEIRIQIGNEISSCEKRYKQDIEALDKEFEQIYSEIKLVRSSLEQDLKVYTQYVDERIKEVDSAFTNIIKNSTVDLNNNININKNDESQANSK